MTEEQYVRNELLQKYCNSSKKSRVGVFATFEGFYQWAMSNGYKPGTTINRRDTTKPISPENCYLVESQELEPFSGEAREDFIRRWNRAVNPLRKLHGLPPLPDPESRKKVQENPMKGQERKEMVLPVTKTVLRAIISGVQKEQYREMTPYWTVRLNHLFDEDGPWYVRFRCGNRAEDPWAECRVDLKIGQGRPEWGAAPGVDYYILDILKVCSTCVPVDWKK